MPAQVLSNAGIYMDEWDLSGASNNIAVEFARDMFDTTAFGDAFRSYTGGMAGLRFSAAGWYDGSATGSEPALFDVKENTTGIITTLVSANTAGSIAYLLRGVVGTYSIGGEVNAAGTYSLQGQTTLSPFVRGTVLHRTTAATATGTAASGYLIGAITDEGGGQPNRDGYATLHIFSIAGTATPTLTVIIESDDNSGFTTPVTRITFDAATVVGSQWKSVAGPVTDTYYRARWTITGTNPSFGFIVSFGIEPPVPVG